MPDYPLYIPPADRAEGEPGEGGCLRTEAEEQEAEATAPEILEAYRAEVREAEEMLNPPPDQPQPTQAAADLQRLGKWPPVPARAPLRTHFEKALHRGAWRAFGFSEDQGRRVPVGSPWRKDLTYGENGEMTDRRGRAYSEVLFYRADRNPDAAKAAPALSSAAQDHTQAPALQSKNEDKPAYGELSKRLHDAEIRYAEELASMRTQKDRATFLAEKTGASESLATQVLRGKT